MKSNEQESFWSGNFGDEYTNRNDGLDLIESNQLLFSEVFKNLPFPKSVIEFGANRGLNLAALKGLDSDIQTTGVEINPNAAQLLRDSAFADTVHEMSATELKTETKFDLVLSKGFLIHINPTELSTIYAQISSLSIDLVLFAEYFSPEPVSVDYRGHQNKLFKRDFAGEFMDAHKEFEVIRTGFAYKRGPIPKDNLTWFLMKRSSSNLSP